jgi:hypothetical protein
MKIKGKKYKENFFLPSGKGYKCYICKRLGMETNASKEDRVYPHHIQGHNKGPTIPLCEEHHNNLVELECETCPKQSYCTKQKFKECWKEGLPMLKTTNNNKKEIKKPFSEMNLEERLRYYKEIGVSKFI